MKKSKSGPAARLLNRLYANISWIPSKDMPASSRRLRAALKVISIVLLKTVYDTVPFRARALALTAVLAVAPMLALGTAVLKGVGIADESRTVVHDFLNRYIVLDVPTHDGKNVLHLKEAGTTGKDLDDRRQNLVVHLQKVANKMFDYVDRTDFATLGFVGTIAILGLVASFFSHLEGAMNIIWQVERGRSLWRRAVNYLSVLVLLPIAMNLGFAAMAVLQSTTLMLRLEALLPAPWMVSLVLKLFPLAVIGGVFTALYKCLPNTAVLTRTAVMGGFLAGAGWLLVLLLYINLQLGVARYNAIYGSFATVPLVLLWIYVGWVIYLIGAEIVFALQVWRTCKTVRMPINSKYPMALVVQILMTIQQAWRTGETISVTEVLKATGQSPMAVHDVLATLESEGCIARNFSDKRGITPGPKSMSLT